MTDKKRRAYHPRNPIGEMKDHDYRTAWSMALAGQGEFPINYSPAKEDGRVLVSRDEPHLPAHLQIRIFRRRGADGKLRDSIEGPTLK